ncbi:cyclic nucleotide-binding domain-containing protein [Rhizobium sp. BE258]|uniref:cyclic nucleotide-binding domain-containing protein n=1 Tax=Rhizobium sp. BE258 TaxID=2817722 RepID=UPI0028596AD5|nr:cyclic nucleotide-binding domain-containing protein [Rhizobium sp. BE258]MDR7147725.1 CRP-like cAMP-binding protein [Rhizobium sp. BE258]
MFDKDTMVVSEGEICHGLFIVRTGVVVVERQLAEKVVELTRLAPHDCFGERSILSSLPGNGVEADPDTSGRLRDTLGTPTPDPWR